MSEICLKDIWDLRGELDRAVEIREYEKITDVKNKFISMMRRIPSKSMLFRNFREKAMNIDSDRVAVSLNKRLILTNIQDFEKKYLRGKRASTKLRKPDIYTNDCYAVNIWVLRAVFYKFVLFDPASASQEQIEQNKTLGESLIDKIRIAKLSAIHEWEKEELEPIENEIFNAYISFCNNNDLDLLHSALVDEFVEKDLY